MKVNKILSIYLRKCLKTFPISNGVHPVKSCVAGILFPTKLFNRAGKGISLIEVLIYMAITTMVLVFVINMMMFTTKTFNGFKISRDIKNSATISMGRMINEIRKAKSVDQTLSLFDNPNGKLALNMINGDKTTLFLDSGILKIENNGTIEGSLSLTDTFINSLVFKVINNTKGQAVKIEINIKDKENGFTKSENFYMTTVLQGSY
ncbi:hypothetical protein KJ991_02325 [Patescibacteria group bacterium]|nr:hypothetical protein [Patescibacteria group bacterium]MBU4057605.1 hypothetical protein [Patescibacteria group bacterium]MBU4115624.1 hypothetical protein [Patescibacteria group bacterium]